MMTVNTRMKSVEYITKPDLFYLKFIEAIRFVNLYGHPDHSLTLL